MLYLFSARFSTDLLHVYFVRHFEQGEMWLPKKQVVQNIPFCVFSHRPSRATLATTLIKGIDRLIEWHQPLKMASTVYDPEICDATPMQRWKLGKYTDLQWANSRRAKLYCQRTSYYSLPKQHWSSNVDGTETTRTPKPREFIHQ